MPKGCPSSGKSPWRKVLMQDPCAWCGKYGQPTVDHIKPRRYGARPHLRGSDSWQNQTGSCYECNQDKGDLSLLEYLVKRQEKRLQAKVLAKMQKTYKMATMKELIGAYAKA